MILKPDLRLISKVSGRMIADENCKGPFIKYFSRPPIDLIFVGSDHDHADATFPFIERAFDLKIPKALIIEMYLKGKSPKAYRRRVEVVKADGFTNNEPAFAASLAFEKGIPVYGGEPSVDHVVKEVLNPKRTGGDVFTRDDIFYFYILRRLCQLRRDGGFGKRVSLETAFEKISKFISYTACDLKYPSGEHPDLSRFKPWYQEKSGERFTRQFDRDHVTPYIEGNFFQRLCAYQNHIRDRVLARRITDILNRHQNVTIVYGSGHFPVQKRVLEPLLGEPILSE